MKYDPQSEKTEVLWNDYYHYSALYEYNRDNNLDYKHELLTQRNIVKELVRRGEIQTI